MTVLLHSPYVYWKTNTVQAPWVTVGEGKITNYLSTNDPGYTVISPTLAMCVNSSCPDGFLSSWAVVILRQRWMKQRSWRLALALPRLWLKVLEGLGSQEGDREDLKKIYISLPVSGCRRRCRTCRWRSRESGSWRTEPWTSQSPDPTEDTHTSPRSEGSFQWH